MGYGVNKPRDVRHSTLTPRPVKIAEEIYNIVIFFFFVSELFFSFSSSIDISREYIFVVRPRHLDYVQEETPTTGTVTRLLRTDYATTPNGLTERGVVTPYDPRNRY